MARIKGSGRPYPRDTERQILVKIELAKRNMTITQLSKEIKILHLSEIIAGIRISPINEEKVAAFFGKQREELFPIRTKKELMEMREKEISTLKESKKEEVA